MKKIAVECKAGLTPGYYFYDTIDNQVYQEGGRYDKLDDILKVDSDKFYVDEAGDQLADSDNSLGILYIDAENKVWAVDPVKRTRRRVASETLPEVKSSLSRKAAMDYSSTQEYKAAPAGSVVSIDGVNILKLASRIWVHKENNGNVAVSSVHPDFGITTVWMRPSDLALAAREFNSL